MILILSAVAQENAHLSARLFKPETHTCGPFAYQCGTLDKHRAAIATCGIGMANAAGCCAALLQHIQPCAVILCGCGGAYPSSGLKVGDLALAHTEIYADTGAITPNGFLSMRDMNLPLLEHKHARYYNHFPLSSDLSKSAHQAIQGFASQCGCALRQGNFTTLATCTGTDSRAAAMEEFSAGMCENMEGAGVAHMCCMFDTPVVEVRAISNMVQARNLADWDLPEAMQRAQEAVLFWLQNTPIQTFTSQDI